MMRGYPCRCSKCRTRRTLSKLPNQYKIEKFAKCMIHGCDGEMRVDWHRKKKEHKKNLCSCYGYSFVHRKGGGVWCEQHPTGPTEQDYIDRYGHEAV